MRITVVATVATLAFAGPAWATEETPKEKGKGTETAPGQTKPEQAPATGHAKGSDQAAKPEPKAKAKAKPKPARAAKPKPAKAAKPEAAAPKSSNGKAHQKTTLCHATGSATNPYVTITISNAAVKAHARHQDGRDIIPAPAGGCPKPAPATAPAAASPEAPKAHEKVTLCHSTGSATNPFVVITVDSHAVKAHAAHHDGRDIIPAPAGGCPAPVEPAVTTTAPPTTTTTLLAAPVAQSGPLAALSAPATPAANEVLGETAEAPGAEASVPGADNGAAPDDVAGRESGADTTPAATASLPFTGMDTWLLIAAGIAFLIGGVALRRASALR